MVKFAVVGPVASQLPNRTLPSALASTYVPSACRLKRFRALVGFSGVLSRNQVPTRGWPAVGRLCATAGVRVVRARPAARAPVLVRVLRRFRVNGGRVASWVMGV